MSADPGRNACAVTVISFVLALAGPASAAERIPLDPPGAGALWNAYPVAAARPTTSPGAAGRFPASAGLATGIACVGWQWT